MGKRALIEWPKKARWLIEIICPSRDRATPRALSVASTHTISRRSNSINFVSHVNENNFQSIYWHVQTSEKYTTKNCTDLRRASVAWHTKRLLPQVSFINATRTTHHLLARAKDDPVEVYLTEEQAPYSSGQPLLEDLVCWLAPPQEPRWNKKRLKAKCFNSELQDILINDETIVLGEKLRLLKHSSTQMMNQANS